MSRAPTSWLILCMLALSVAQAQESLRVVPLRFADSALIAGMFGGSTAGAAGVVDPDAFARESMAQAVLRLPQAEGYWLPNLQGRSTPGRGSGVLQPPTGLTQPPVAVPNQNAILLRGTPEAIDRMQEMIELLDKPQPMVNIELKLLDAPEEQVEEWGVDFRAFGRGVAGGSVGNAPATGLQARYGLGNLQAQVGWDQRRTRGRTATGTNVTTFDNTPATVSFGETLPFFAAHVTRDVFGNRHVEYEPQAIFAGIELFVHPRITGNDTVTMRLAPTIVEAAGAVSAPDGQSIPVTREILTETQVHVRDGESLVIGGFQRYADEANDRFRSLLGGKRVQRSSHPVLVVTPHIVIGDRPQQGGVR